MNPRRVAAALRDFAEAATALAKELDDEESGDTATEVPPAPKSKPRKKPRRLPPMPANVTDFDRAFAAAILNRKGYRKADG